MEEPLHIRGTPNADRPDPLQLRLHGVAKRRDRRREEKCARQRRPLQKYPALISCVPSREARTTRSARSDVSPSVERFVKMGRNSVSFCTPSNVIIERPRVTWRNPVPNRCSQVTPLAY